MIYGAALPTATQFGRYADFVSVQLIFYVVPNRISEQAEFQKDRRTDFGKTMQNPFIMRVYKIDGHDVECRFFPPEQGLGDYFCRYEIDLPSKPIASQGYGADQIQALLLAMKKAHVELLVMRDKLGLRVEWLDNENLGLPINEIVRDLAPNNSY